MDVPYYPINDYGPAMKGLIIGGVGIVHVFVAQFAVGAGALMCYFQWLARGGKNEPARQFVQSYFQFVILIAFVVGVISGVGLWFTSIQTSPRTIGMMVDAFIWIWATEWAFFGLEIVAGYAFYRYQARLDDRARMGLLLMYTFAAWMSLFWINGIISWQLTPGKWEGVHDLWAGFFNPSFWPSLLYRTIVCLTIAVLAACVVINTLGDLDRASRGQLIHRASHVLILMAAMPVLGFWYLSVIPSDSREWVLGSNVTMSMFTILAVVASLLIGLYALVGLIIKRLYINGATATLLCGLAFGATAAGEFVREGSRKPYTVRRHLFSNGVTPNEAAHLREVGSVTNDPYPLRQIETYPDERLKLGAKVFRFQCSVCHTVDGVNGILHLTGTWTIEQKRMNIAQLQHTKAFMPPFVGTVDEVESLVQYLNWSEEGHPREWKASTDPAARGRIQRWLDEVGVVAADVYTATARVGQSNH